MDARVDVTAYVAQIGGHIIKVKPRTTHIDEAEAEKVYEKVFAECHRASATAAASARSSAATASSARTPRPRAAFYNIPVAAGGLHACYNLVP